MERNPWVRALIILLVLIAAFYLARILWELGSRVGDVILIFFLAWLLAFILNPIAKFLIPYNRRSKLLAVVEVYVGFLFFLVLLSLLAIPSIANQMYQLGQALPAYLEQLPLGLSSIQAWLSRQGLNIDLSTVYQGQALVQRAEGLGTLVAQNALGIAQSLASAVVGLVIILMLSFYMMLDGERIMQGLVKLLPDRYQDEGRFFLDSIDRTFGGFMRGALIQALIYAVGTGLVMWLAGLSFVVVISAFAGLMMFIPFLGTFLAIIPPLLMAIFSGSLAKVIFVLVALLILQQIVLNVIAPKVMSESVGIHPLLVFLAILMGFKVAGIWGAIFGVPVIGVVNAMAQYFIARARGPEPRTPPKEHPKVISKTPT
jgi:predicted PurR-regulated permease PerM